MQLAETCGHPLFPINTAYIYEQGRWDAKNTYIQHNHSADRTAFQSMGRLPPRSVHGVTCSQGSGSSECGCHMLCTAAVPGRECLAVVAAGVG